MVEAPGAVVLNNVGSMPASVAGSDRAIIEHNTEKSLTVTLSTNATLTGNNLGAAGSSSLSCTSASTCLTPLNIVSSDGLTATGNNITGGNDDGVWVANSANVTLHGNNIGGNAWYGVETVRAAGGTWQVGSPVDASDNWWGCAEGPASVARVPPTSGECDGVAPIVTFSPWAEARLPI
jgi:hypothetical protein